MKRSSTSNESTDESGHVLITKRLPTQSLSPFLPWPYSSRSVLGVDSFLNVPSNVLVDKTVCIINLPERFQCLLLRPPQFSKTTFLSTLYHFYDLHGAMLFEKRFASRAVVTEASISVPHSQHLSLMFDLSTIYVYTDLVGLVTNLTNQINLDLWNFLDKYANDLGVSDPDIYLGDTDDDLEHMFVKIFELVKASGHTLFVAVDNYDAPTRVRTFAARAERPDSYQDFATAREIELALNSSFWEPLMKATSVIHKLCITGVVLIDYPALRNLDDALMPALHNACGYTDDEALFYAQSLLQDPPSLAELQPLCGKFLFTNAAASMPQPLIHPRLLLNYIFDAGSDRALVDRQSYKLLSDLFKMVPQASNAVPGSITVEELILLVATGGVQAYDDRVPPFDLDATSIVNWSMLRLAGALTYDRETEDTLRITSKAALSLIHTCVDDLFSECHHLGFIFYNALRSFTILGDPEPLLDILLNVFRRLTPQCFGSQREPNLQGVFELIFCNSHCQQWRRVVEPMILRAPGSMMSVEVQIPAYQTDKVLTLKLTTLTLCGIWLALHPNDDKPTAHDLEGFYNELVFRSGDELLEMPYHVWSPTLETMETRLVGSFFDEELPENPHFLAVGGAHVLLRQRPRDEQGE